MKLFVGITDSDWFELLAAQPRLDDVNFWQPGGNRRFKALQPGELFLFKLHSPADFIVGGGLFAHATLLPVSLAWDSFGISNGARTLLEMRARVEKYRRQTPASSDYQIGCILLEQPFFLARQSWITVPADWSRNIVQGKTYDAQAEPGASLYRKFQESLRTDLQVPATVAESELPRYGNASVVFPRLGQGSFRVLVTDAYERRCAVTGERTLPVLQAAHIHPYAIGGPHRVDNGLLLRSDLHTLFDRGYLTVTPAARLEVSSRIREEFENGRDYYALHGKVIRLPPRSELCPSPALLGWHNENVFLG